MRFKTISTMLIPLFLLSACISSSITSQNVTWPVLVGPVKKINGSPVTVIKDKVNSIPVSTEAHSVFMVFSDSQVTTVSQFKHGSNKGDIEILKNAEQGEIVHIENLQIGSYVFYPFLWIYSKVYNGFEGTVFPDHKNIDNIYK